MEVARPQNEWKGSIVEAEPFQIGLYSPGGHYLPHNDAFDVLDPQSRTPEGLWVGNRIATMITYLSDVMGGATAFVKIGLAVRPKPGSALIWFNLNSDGSRSLHLQNYD